MQLEALLEFPTEYVALWEALPTQASGHSLSMSKFYWNSLRSER